MKDLFVFLYMVFNEIGRFEFIYGLHCKMCTMESKHWYYKLCLNETGDDNSILYLISWLLIQTFITILLTQQFARKTISYFLSLKIIFVTLEPNIHLRYILSFLLFSLKKWLRKSAANIYWHSNVCYKHLYKS